MTPLSSKVGEKVNGFFYNAVILRKKTVQKRLIFVRYQQKSLGSPGVSGHVLKKYVFFTPSLPLNKFEQIKTVSVLYC